MAIGFPASYNETRRFNLQQEKLKSAIEDTFESLSWKYLTVSFFTYRASLSINALSWGELIVVEILPNGEVNIASKCAFPMQLFDWGKNRRNVQTFFSRLKLTFKYLENAAADRRIEAFDEKGFSPVERIFDESNGELNQNIVITDN